MTDSAADSGPTAGTTPGGTGTTPTGTDTTPTCGGPDAPVLSADRVELQDEPQIGPLVYFALAAADPQEDLDGGELAIALYEDSAPFYDDRHPISAEPGVGVLYANSLLVFGIEGLDLDATYTYTISVEDAAGNLSCPLDGEVPPYDG